MFKPKGDKPEWQLVYELLAACRVGEVVDYQAINEALGRDLRPSRGPYYRAQKELEKRNKRTTTAVPGRGYRIVDAAEHEGLARHHLKKSGRQLRRAKAKTASADRSRLTPEEKRRIDAMDMNLSQLQQTVRRQSRRIDRIEKVIEQTGKTTNRNRSDLRQLSNRVEELAAVLEAQGFVDVKRRAS